MAPTYSPFLVVAVFGAYAQAATPAVEDRVFSHIFTDYNVLSRPVATSGKPLNVTLTFAVQRMISFDPEEKILTIAAWMTEAWTDYRLRWDVEKFDGVRDIAVPQGQIWEPDIELYNDAGRGKSSKSSQIKYVVDHSGAVLAVPILVLDAPCRDKEGNTGSDSDEYLCQFKFGSWTRSAADINLVHAGMSMNAKSSRTMDAVKSEIKRNVVQYNCCPDPYTEVEINLTLRKKQ